MVLVASSVVRTDYRAEGTRCWPVAVLFFVDRECTPHFNNFSQPSLIVYQEWYYCNQYVELGRWTKLHERCLHSLRTGCMILLGCIVPVPLAGVCDTTLFVVSGQFVMYARFVYFV